MTRRKRVNQHVQRENAWVVRRKKVCSWFLGWNYPSAAQREYIFVFMITSIIWPIVNARLLLAANPPKNCQRKVRLDRFSLFGEDFCSLQMTFKMAVQSFILENCWTPQKLLHGLLIKEFTVSAFEILQFYDMAKNNYINDYYQEVMC